MMKKEFQQAQLPSRLIVLGARGFIGSHIVASCVQDGVTVLSLSKTELDLTQETSVAVLSSILQPEDVVVFLSTLTPRYGKGIDAFINNISIGQHVVQAVKKTPVAHLVYLSSDAVYPFGENRINEKTLAAPQDLYGCMHRARELMLETIHSVPLAVLRSTLVYGLGDPHNSYGPNRMIRSARDTNKIELFGAGEETRDHICIDDVVQLIKLTIYHRCTGILNLVSGSSASYYDLAQILCNFMPKVHIETSERKNQITHRAFDVSLRNRLFPHFQDMPLELGIGQYLNAVTRIG